MNVLNKFVEVSGVVIGSLASFFTKLVGFTSAYVSEVAGANQEVVDRSKEVASKVGDKLLAVGKCAGEIGGKAVDKTAVLATGAAAVVASGVNKALDGDDEKLDRVQSVGVAATAVGIAVLTAGIVLTVSAKKNRRKHELEDFDM